MNEEEAQAPERRPARERTKRYSVYSELADERKLRIEAQRIIDRYKPFHDAIEYLTETRQLKEYFVWSCRREGMSEAVLASIDRACDKIDYAAGGEPAVDRVAVNQSNDRDTEVKQSQTSSAADPMISVR